MSDNPKDLIGSTKLPLSMAPATAITQMVLALLDGASKYGKYNWRATPVRASIYVDAALRHVAKYHEGEEYDPDSGISHLGHALASLAILVDASVVGTLVDDRAYNGLRSAEYVTAAKGMVGVIQGSHASHEAPYHYTIGHAEPTLYDEAVALEADLADPVPVLDPIYDNIHTVGIVKTPKAENFSKIFWVGDYVRTLTDGDVGAPVGATGFVTRLSQGAGKAYLIALENHTGDEEDNWYPMYPEELELVGE